MSLFNGCFKRLQKIFPNHAFRIVAGRNVRSAFGLAMDSIRSHKLRSFLTLLGVIIGVASVIMVGAAIEGLGVYAERSTAIE